MKVSSFGSSIIEPAQAEMTDGQFLLFRDLISARTGISLREAKCPMLSARLQRRLRALKISSFEAYYQFLLKQDPAGEERRELVNCITTNKTSFFREPHHFEFLAKLFQSSLTARAMEFSAWSAACSTGEEPYSIAMTLRNVFDPSTTTRDITILASDIDTQVLGHATSAIYNEADLEPVPTPLRQRFFLRGSGSQSGRYRIKPEIRNLVDFRQLNFVDPAWPVTGMFDIIFCRNVVIYFEQATQDRILRRLVGYLKPGGHLIVGHSEHLHWMTDIVQPVGTTIYKVKHG